MAELYGDQRGLVHEKGIVRSTAGFIARRRSNESSAVFILAGRADIFPGGEVSKIDAKVPKQFGSDHTL